MTILIAKNMKVSRRSLKMPKFIVEVGFDDEEDIKFCNQTYEEIVYEALRDYSFDIIRVEKVDGDN